MIISFFNKHTSQSKRKKIQYACVPYFGSYFLQVDPYIPFEDKKLIEPTFFIFNYKYKQQFYGFISSLKKINKINIYIYYSFDVRKYKLENWKKARFLVFQNYQSIFFFDQKKTIFIYYFCKKIRLYFLIIKKKDNINSYRILSSINSLINYRWFKSLFIQNKEFINYYPVISGITLQLNTIYNKFKKSNYKSRCFTIKKKTAIKILIKWVKAYKFKKRSKERLKEKLKRRFDFIRPPAFTIKKKIAIKILIKWVKAYKSKKKDKKDKKRLKVYKFKKEDKKVYVYRNRLNKGKKPSKPTSRRKQLNYLKNKIKKSYNDAPFKELSQHEQTQAKRLTAKKNKNNRVLSKQQQKQLTHLTNKNKDKIDQRERELKSKRKKIKKNFWFANLIFIFKQKKTGIHFPNKVNYEFKKIKKKKKIQS